MTEKSKKDFMRDYYLLMCLPLSDKLAGVWMEDIDGRHAYAVVSDAGESFSIQCSAEHGFTDKGFVLDVLRGDLVGAIPVEQ